MNRKFISNSNYVFRKILNSEESLSILKNFIEAILNIKIKEEVLECFWHPRAFLRDQEITL